MPTVPRQLGPTSSQANVNDTRPMPDVVSPAQASRPSRTVGEARPVPDVVSTAQAQRHDTRRCFVIISLRCKGHETGPVTHRQTDGAWARPAPHRQERWRLDGATTELTACCSRNDHTAGRPGQFATIHRFPTSTIHRWWPTVSAAALRAANRADHWRRTVPTAAHLERCGRQTQQIIGGRPSLRLRALNDAGGKHSRSLVADRLHGCAP